MLEPVGKRYQSLMCVRHDITQAKVHHHSNNHPCGRNHGDVWQSGGHIKGQYASTPPRIVSRRSCKPYFNRWQRKGNFHQLLWQQQGQAILNNNTCTKIYDAPLDLPQRWPRPGWLLKSQPLIGERRYHLQGWQQSLPLQGRKHRQCHNHRDYKHR